MSKRSATEVVTADGQPFAKASGSGSKRDDITRDEMGEFEDAWEDELESDEEVVDAEGADGLCSPRLLSRSTYFTAQAWKWMNLCQL